MGVKGSMWFTLFHVNVEPFCIKKKKNRHNFKFMKGDFIAKSTPNLPGCGSSSVQGTGLKFSTVAHYLKNFQMKCCCSIFCKTWFRVLSFCPIIKGATRQKSTFSLPIMTKVLLPLQSSSWFIMQHVIVSDIFILIKI